MNKRDYIDQFDDEYEQRAAAAAWEEGVYLIYTDPGMIQDALSSIADTDDNETLRAIGALLLSSVFHTGDTEAGKRLARHIGEYFRDSATPYLLRRVQDYADAERWRFMPRQGDREEDRQIAMAEKDGEL